MQNRYIDREASIWTEYSEADWVPVGKKVKQYPPLIYSIYLPPSILRKAGFKDECDCNIRERKINNPCYVDDTTLIRKTGL